MHQKTFLVINLSFFGDILITNGLVQNIKLNYPDSKIIFIVNKPFYDVAKYQEGVDEVFCFDKRGENKGLIGLLKFILKFPYRNKIDTSFIIYGNERATLMSYLLGSKIRISGERFINKFIANRIHRNLYNDRGMYYNNTDLIRSLTGEECEILPIKYNTALIEDEIAQQIISNFKDKDVIGLCCLSKNPLKDMPVETAAEIINKLCSDNKTVFLFGTGNNAEEYAHKLELMGCKFENLTNKTTIKGLAKIIKFCKGVISVDTGTMHLTYAVGTPLVSIFYLKEYVKIWAPNTELYKAIVISEDYSAKNITDKLYSLLEAN